MGAGDSFKYVTCLMAEVPVSITTNGIGIKYSPGDAESNIALSLMDAGLKCSLAYSEHDISVSSENAESFKQGIGQGKTEIAFADEGLGTNYYCTGSSEAIVMVDANGRISKYIESTATPSSRVNIAMFGKHARYNGIWDITRQRTGFFLG